MTDVEKQETMEAITARFCALRSQGAIFLCRSRAQAVAVEEMMKAFDAAAAACDALTDETPTNDVIRSLCAWHNAFLAAAKTGAKVSPPRRVPS